MEIKEAFEVIDGVLREYMGNNNFSIEGNRKGKDDVIVSTDENIKYVTYAGENRYIKLKWYSDAKKMTLNIAVDPEMTVDIDGNESAPEEAFKECSVWAFDENHHDERDLKSIGNDFLDTIREKIGDSAAKDLSNVKMPHSVSKSAAKKGTIAFDTNTLLNKFTTIYPELKTPAKENISKYGSFMPEEFFSKYGAPKVLETVKRNDQIEMRKLFNMFNDMYENGSSDVQGIIIVTLLGEINNDAKLMENIDSHMDETLKPVVIAYNKYIVTSGGQRKKRKLENPPEYKPKKEKKTFMSKMYDQMGQQGPQ